MRRPQRLLVFVAVSALLMSLAAVVAIGVGIYHYRTVLTKTERVRDDGDDSTTKRAALPADDDTGDSADTAAPSSLDDVVKETETQVRGRVEVVDVGVRSAALPDVLLAQRIVADTKQQIMVVMLNGRQCDPCRDFDDAIEDARMQQALDSVRLVRIDLEVFKDELKRMALPTNLYPAFFLLGDDLRPLDAIHGGEWDDDIAQNMAPVLGPFIRGELHERRHADWAPTTSSIQL